MEPYDENMSTISTPKESRGRQAVGLIAWLAFCFASSATAAFIGKDAWYESLKVPSWNPPSWVFGPVWTVLYVMMAVAAWMIWRQGGWKVQWRALCAFCVQWLFNVLWTPLFFGAHRPDLAFFDIVLLWFALVVTIVLFWRVKMVAGVVLLPYLAWVSFAAVLNFSIWRLNL